jgi:hypothetical protein
VTERSRAATPSPWRRPGPSVQLPPPTDRLETEPDERAELDEREERQRKNSRRLIRWVAIVAGVILAVLACWQDPLYAL